ncbi:MAG: hypothetical protein IPO03_02520 [Bacteroidetes bacterium]|nr:hypothetical protein [Bacteroidota bacterium]
MIDRCFIGIDGIYRQAVPAQTNEEHREVNPTTIQSSIVNEDVKPEVLHLKLELKIRY